MAVDYEKLGAFYLGREYEAASAALTDNLVLYDSKDLTTHAVCVGMTGSGKTGLCLSLLEEAAIDGIPAICIDPKGDLGNLLLAFPELEAAQFAPWMDPADAERKGLSIDALAARTAETWKNGLAEWGQTPERIGKFRDSVEVSIYTPGAETGLALSVLRSFAAPPAAQLADSTTLRERVGAIVAGLLSLLGREADPLQSREHILLANIIEAAWRYGTNLDLTGLIHAVQKPPFDKIGAFDLETFYPTKDRLALAMAINNLLASPGFETWMKGEPLDAQRLLFTPEGKPRISIISIAHLGDAERMFIVTLVLNEVIAWMRQQSGTSSLRALLYMDEIFGYFPPTANPPSKLPMLTLLKQARAFGLGCVLATQNPVDLDYKGLANCGTWLIGRLQTERDKLRVIDGLESALTSAGGFDRAALDRMMSSLSQRVFLMRNVHEDAPILMKSRWALSYLRGPLTGAEIAKVMAPAKAARAAIAASAASANPATAPTPTAAAGTTKPAGRPALQPGITEYFLSSGDMSPRYRPRVLGIARLHFVDGKLGLDQWSARSYLAPLSDDGKQALWSEGTVHESLDPRLTRAPLTGADFDELPGAAMRAASYKDYGRQLESHLYQNERAVLLVCDAVKLASTPGEAEGDFRARLSLAVHKKRDEQVASLRDKLAPKVQRLQDQLRRADERLAREQDQLKDRKVQTAMSVGASVLGALFGRKKISAATVGRVSTAARSASRIGRESADVDRAEESREVLQQRLVDLQAECEAEIEQLSRELEPAALPLRQIAVTPRKSDLEVIETALVWATPSSLS